MSRLRVLICRVDEHDDAQMTELAHLDLPPLRPQWGPACLDLLEAQVAEVGQHLLARLCELQWEELDAQAVGRYAAQQPAGSVVADGYAPLHRQVCAQRLFSVRIGTP